MDPVTIGMIGKAALGLFKKDKDGKKESKPLPSFQGFGAEAATEAAGRAQQEFMSADEARRARRREMIAGGG
jgi:hypothetical protein